MKTSLKYYEIGSTVYAADHYHVNGKQSLYLSIREAVVKSINIDRNEDNLALEVSYWLATPKGEDWGDCVLSQYVSDSYAKLVESLRQEWMAGSNDWDE